MSAFGFGNSYLDFTNSEKDLHLAAGLSAAGDVQDRQEEVIGNAEGTNNFAIDSLHQIAVQIVAGDTLDEILVGALKFITVLVHSESCVAHVLQGEKFEPWVWQTRQPVRESAPDLNQEVEKSLAEHRVPIALSREPAQDRRISLFERWSRDPGETFICVPLLSRKKLVGAISFRHSPYAYTEHEVKLLSTIGYVIGADIGIALAETENAALREDLETMKLVERGKGVLQRDLRVSEQQAYLILEHLSRQRRKSVKEIAKTVILGDEVKRQAVSG
ncbi:MAG TPA: GAF and ANTAR domain-containing protein [Terriglobales bacterium]|nr:GAF and ANTAR domain-containing protein [Terriglobales bacterium]